MIENPTTIHPSGYLVLVKVHFRKQVGSILLPDQKQDDDKLASAVGQVVELGPDAFRDDHKFPSGARAKVGDYVLYPRWNGLRITVGEDQYRLINDDEIMAVTSDPDSFRI
jgi:co-chaperonin GroES (HSP10)